MVRDHCRSCNAEIVWAVTVKDRRIPIDPEPASDGNITLLDQGRYRPPLAQSHMVRADGMKYYKSHFATCPQSKAWRKPREKKDAAS